MNTNFEIVDSYYGWGDPGRNAPGIWFIGIEEAARFSQDLIEFEREVNKLKPYQESHHSFVKDFAKENTGRKTIPNIESRIVCALTGENWEEYRDRKLWHENTGVFHANLYPLGKAALSEQHTTEIMRRFGFENSDEYLTYVREIRFDKLYRFWQACSPQATICFGYENKKDFEHLFRTSNCSFEWDFVCYSDFKSKIMLTHHFARAFPPQTEAHIVERLKEWHVTFGN
jgi:hypothetical protein